MFADKSTISGVFTNDTIQEGQYISCQTGNVYKGSFMNFKKHGKGVMTFKDGSVYEGEFLNGKIQGSGSLKSKPNPQGQVKISKGTFNNGVMNGPGTQTGYDGAERKGVWDNGRRVEWVN